MGAAVSGGRWHHAGITRALALMGSLVTNVNSSEREVSGDAADFPAL